MLERFDDAARRAFVLAHEEARRYRHAYVGTEHLLLAVLREVDGLAVQALASSGWTPDGVRAQLKAAVVPGADDVPGHLPLTPRSKTAVEHALRESLGLGHDYIGVEHLLLGLIREGEGVAAQVLVGLGLDLDGLRGEVRRLVAESAEGPIRRGTPVHQALSGALDRFGRSLTQAARDGRLDPVVGRDAEIARVLQVLSRRDVNSAVLVGEPGVGVEQVVEGVARHLAVAVGGGSGPRGGTEVLAVEAASMADDAVHEPVRAAIAVAPGQLVLAVALRALSAPTAGAPLPAAAAVVRGAMAAGEVRVVATATPEEYRRLALGDEALLAGFQRVDVVEPEPWHAVQILGDERARLEAHHRVSVTDDALVAAVALAHRFVADRLLPASAIDLLDDAGARSGVRRSADPPELREVDDRLAAARRAKEAALDDQDFVVAARHRDEEKRLLGQRRAGEERWRAAAADAVAVIDVDQVVEVVAARTGLLAPHIRAELPATTATAAVDDAWADGDAPTHTYRVLNDLPVRDEEGDLLGSAAAGRRIAAILEASRGLTPFVLAVDGGWGTGKSTLLQHIDRGLADSPGLRTVWFNAWTAQGENALEGLIKSVLVELDRRVVRRWVRRAARRGHVAALTRLALVVGASFAGVGRLVDGLWSRTGADAQTRNELRACIAGMVGEWVAADGPRDPGRALVVFVDDLDRCSDDAVIGVCEAIKLYLDAPGLVFVLACDLSVIARGVSTSARGTESDGRRYLEKIVQVAHRVPAPDAAAIHDLIDAYAARSGTVALVDGAVRDVLAEQAGRNPRRIKRILNSFVLASHLDPTWRRPPLGGRQLITATLLQHLYPAFYDQLLSDDAGVDPIGDFLDYAALVRRGADPPAADDAWWATTMRTFRRLGASPPERIAGRSLVAEIAALDAVLPPGSSALARNEPFVSLLRGVGDRRTRAALRAQLVRTAPPADLALVGPVPP